MLSMVFGGAGTSGGSAVLVSPWGYGLGAMIVPQPFLPVFSASEMPRGQYALSAMETMD